MRKSLLSLIVLSLSASAASAAGSMQPGLWEMTMKSDAFRNMPKIPPEQMERMRRMGIEIPQLQNGGMTTRVCISRAMAERDEPPALDQKEIGCESKNFQRSGNAYAVDIVCDGKDIKGQGKARGAFQSSQSFTSTYDFKGTVQGQPVDQHHESSGKWLSADCGGVKPMDDMMKK